MDSPQLFLAFGAVMLIAALLGVAIDWFGKPLRHRKFVPKAYRYPDERQPRRSNVRATDWSDASFVLPVTEYGAQLTSGAAPQSAGPSALGAAPPEGYPRDIGPPTAQVPVIFDDPDLYDPPADPWPTGGIGQDAEADPLAGTDAEDLGRPDELLDLAPPAIVTLEDTNPDDPDLLEDTNPDDPDLLEDTNPDDPDLLEDLGDPEVSDVPVGASSSDTGDGTDAPITERPDARSRGWKPGDYVFNLTPDGREPSSTTVRNRYWKNVAGTGGAGIFGATNLERMASGKPPRRRNHRTGKVESMRLPAANHRVTAGETPVPEWDSPELDPFA